MLKRLAIRDFVIVESLELEFRPGFTVLTGETGAGKSILIDALALVLGERSDAGQVRLGAERAEIEAEFDVSGREALAAWLAENGLEGDPGVLLLRRVLEAGGRSRAFVNGRGATLQQMKEAGDALVDIHGQHAHQSLLRGDAQRALLDGYAGAGAAAAGVRDAWRAWQSARAAREQGARDASALQAERESLEWNLRDATALELGPDDWEALGAEHQRLAHAASLMACAESGLDSLSEGEAAWLPRLHALIAQVAEQSEHDAGLLEVLELLEPAQVQLQEAVYALRHYRDRIELDPDRLAQVERRLEAIHALARRHRVPPGELHGLVEQWKERLQALADAGDSAALERREREAQGAYDARAAELSKLRSAAAGRLSSEVTAAMQQLAMAGGSFRAALQPVDGGGPHGLEQVEFQVTAHAGTPLRPLAKVASGGELSRIGLAIQVVTSRLGEVPTLIFDEVDAGIGGGVAEVVGRMLRRLGAERQVMCITHLPQVAAAGEHHWRVSKSADGGAVSSRVEVLGAERRVEEVARMLGGVEITETTRAHASEMLGRAP